MLRACLSLVVLLAPAGAMAGESTATTREIRHLFSVLEASPCRFQRNGTWHDAAEASNHLRRKRDYLARKGLLTSTEAFIDLAASRSSLTGQAYQVQCGRDAALSSAAWFRAELAAYRQRATPTRPGP